MLTLDKIGFAHENQPVISGFSLNAEAGSLIVLKGMNGSGKTTLLKLIAGLLSTDTGTIKIKGKSVAQSMASLIYLGHKSGLKAELSVTENLKLLMALTGNSSQRSLTEVLNQVGLAGKEDTQVAKLSAGQKKRVSLARLLLCDADIWLLDEPYSNLDANGTHLLTQMLSQQTKQGLAVVTATESIANLDSSCQEIVLG